LQSTAPVKITEIILGMEIDVKIFFVQNTIVIKMIIDLFSVRRSLKQAVIRSTTHQSVASWRGEKTPVNFSLLKNAPLVANFFFQKYKIWGWSEHPHLEKKLLLLLLLSSPKISAKSSVDYCVILLTNQQTDKRRVSHDNLRRGWRRLPRALRMDNFLLRWNVVRWRANCLMRYLYATGTTLNSLHRALTASKRSSVTFCTVTTIGQYKH